MVTATMSPDDALREALDSITTAVLAETLENLSRATDGFTKNARMRLDGRANYALSRPRIFERFQVMLADRLLPRYLSRNGRKLIRQRVERERPRITIERESGSTACLVFKIGGKPEEIARELKSPRPKQLQLL